MLKYVFDSCFWVTIKTIIIRIKFLSKNVSIGHGCNVSAKVHFEGNNVISKDSNFSGSLGYGSYIGKNSDINASIGRYTCVGPYVRTMDGMHPIKDFVSIHPAFYSSRRQAGFTYTSEMLFREKNGRVKVGNDVWIGGGVTILNGAQIGDGAVVAAGAVVAKDVAPYTIVGGVPAKVISQRFSEDEIRSLEKIAWWDWDSKVLGMRATDFTEISNFVRKYLAQEERK